MPPVGSNTLPLPYSQVPPPRREQRQPMRTSKLGTKLKVLPTQPETPTIPEEEEDDDEEEVERQRIQQDEGGVEFYTPLSQIPAGTARRDAQKLTKTEKAKLPRVTAYCTAASYNLPALQAHLSTRASSYRTHPRMFDTECLHTPYLPPPSASAPFRSPSLKPSNAHTHIPEGDLLNLNDSPPGPNREAKRRTGFKKNPGAGRRKSTAEDGIDSENDDDFEEEEWVPDVFMFEYGTVVIWGMTEKEEKSFLKILRKFEVERLSQEDVEMEDLNFYYADYSRIYNDVITLRKGSSYMTKLSLSHALSQSVKISLFEELISSTIEQTKDIPRSLSETGKIGLPRSEIMKQIGNLFILRININLVGSILDSPEFFWTFPDLEPLYNAARSYLEIGQRIDLLNARVDVLQDMLKLLKESVNSSHGERLEAIVIVLIGIEIVLGIITILVDLSFSNEEGMNRRNIPPALPGNPYGQSQAAGMGPAPPLPPGPAPAQPAYAPQADQGAAHAAAWAAYYQSQGIAAPSAYAASPQPAQPAAPIQASGSNPYANYGYGAGARHGHGPAQPGYPAQPAAPIGPTSQSYRPPGAGTQPYAATPAQPAATVAYPQPYSQAAGGAYPGQQGYSSQQYPSQQGYAGQQQQQPQQQQQAYPGWPAQQSQGYNAGQGSPYQSTTAQQPFYPQSQQPQSYTPQAPVSNSPYRPSTPAPMHSQNRPYQPQPGNRLPSGPGRPPISAPTGPQGGFPPSKRPRFDGPGGMGMGMNGNAGMAQPIRPPVRPAVRPGPNMNMGQPGFNGVVRPPNINRGVGIVPPVVRPPIRLGLGGPPPNLGPRGAMPMRGRSGGPVNAPRGPAIMRRNERGASIPQRPETKSDREKEKKHREKEKELKTTMTDFRIVGIEMKALDWKWGLVDGQDDTVEDTEEKNELDDLKQTDQAELPKQAEDVKVDVAGPEDAIEAADTIQMVNEVAADESTSKTSEETEGVKVEHATETNGEAVPAVIETNGEADSVEENPAQAADQEASDGAGVEEKRGEKRKAKTPDGDDDERSTKRPDYHLTHNKPTQGNHESNSNRFRIYFESPPELDRIPKAARRNPNKRWKRESSSVAPSRPEDVEAGDGVPAVQETLDAEGVENGSSDVENKAEPAAPTSETATVEQTVPDELITTGAEPGADPLPVTQAAPPLETPVDVTVTVTTSEVPQESNVAPVDEALSVPSIPIEVTAVDAEDGVPLALEEAVSLPQADQPDSNVNQVDEAIELGDISMRTDSGLIAEVLASSGGGTANEGAAESVGPATDEAEAGPVAPAENGVGHTEPSETLVPSEIGTEVSAGEVESTITKSAENAASAYRSRTRRRSSLSSNDSRDDDAEQPLDGPSFNRLSILYEDSKRRLCFDAAVVQRVKIYRADAKIEVILLPIKSQEVKEETPAGEGVPEDVKVDTETKTALPKGVLVEMYDDTDQRFVSVDQEKLKQLWTETTDHTESVPPVHKAFTPAAASASSLTIVVHLNKKRPLSEPKWCRTNLADEWLVEQFGGKVASSSSGWSGKLEIVDPDPPPTLRTILETWASSSPVGVASDRRAFTTSLLADPNDLLEILLRLTRGERNPTAPTALATAIRTDSPYASHQTHVSLAILAMYRLTTDYAAKAGETVDVLNDKIGDIIKSLPVSMIHKSLDGMFREWERRV